MKRIVLSWVLCAALILTLLPTAALAADGYNDNDYNKIQAFLETEYNGVKNGDRINEIDYSKDNPDTWGVKWTLDGGENYAYRIDWNSKGIGGALDLSGCTHLYLLYVDQNNLTSLDVSNGMAAGSRVECAENGDGFTALNVSGCSGLETLDCEKNGLSTLDLGSLTSLRALQTYSNKLGTLDITRNTNLIYLDCNTNQLASLDVTKNTELAYLICNTNQLTSLDVTKNTELTYLDCSVNQLTSLDITKNIKLETLYCAGNQLAALDINNCTELWDFDCSNNQLSALDIRKNTKLNNITLDNNRLSAIDVTNNPEIWYFTCASNPLTDIKANFSDAKIQLNAGYGGYLELYLDADVDGNVNNDTITVTAKPITGAALLNWTNADKSEASTATNYSLAHGGAYQLTANFLALQSSVASGKIYVGDKLTLTPTVSGGTWDFNNDCFTRDGNTFTALKAGTNTVQYILDGRHAVYEAAVSSLYNVSASANNAIYGSVSGGGAYKPDDTATLHAAPNAGYHFVRWTENGSEVSTSADYSFTVTGDRTLVAVFEKDALMAPDILPVSISCTQTDVTLYGTANGSITVSASGGNSGTYEYSINGNWQSSGIFGNVAAGTYTAAVRDAGNNDNIATCGVTVGQPSYMGNVLAKKLPSKPLAGLALTIIPPAAPKGYTTTGVIYSSSHPSVASVDANGNVTFLAGGKATITTKVVSQTVDKKGRIKTKTTTVKKTVTVKQPVASVSLNMGSVTIARKSKVKLTPSIAPATASSKKLKWTTSNKKVATVSGAGVVTGKAGGTAVITCAATDGSGVSASCEVTVTPIYPTGIKMSRAALTVKIGKTVSLKATVLPKTTDYKTVAWTSSNPAVATVDTKGKVKGLSQGTVTITATTNNGISTSCMVTVP